MCGRWLVVAWLGAGCGRYDFADNGAGADAASGGGMKSQLVLGADPGEPLADFPLLVVLDDQRAARDLMQPDASDLRFYDADGDVLAYEIEQLGAAGGAPLVAWVRVPAIEGATTTLAVDYDDGTPPPLSTDSVWTAGYAGVWHLVDLTDATANHRDGSWVGGAMTAGAGIAGPTLAFAGAAQDAIAIPDDPGLAFGEALTVSGWLAPVALDAASGYTCIASRQNGADVNDDFWIGADNPTSFADSVVSVASGVQLGTPGHAIPVADWTAIAMTYDGTTERLYVDGAQVTTTAVTGALLHGAHPLLLGADHNSSNGVADSDFVDGLIDEVRIEAVVRDAAWLGYDNRSVRDQLITYGPVTR